MNAASSGPGLPVAWADATFQGIQTDSDRVVIKLKDHRGVRVDVVCEGWIALSIAYFRDDSFTESARLLTDDPRIDAARQVVAQRPGDSGSPSRDAGVFSLLEVTLDDGARLECVAAPFQVTLAHAD